MTLIEQIDTRTLAFVSGIGGLLMVATMTGSYWAGMRGRALGDWAIAGLCFFLGYQLGYVLLDHNGRLPQSLSATLANSVIALGHVFVLAGVRRYLGTAPRTGPLLAIAVAFFAVTVLLEAAPTNTRWRVMLVSVLYLGLDVAAGVQLWRARASGLTLYRRMAATILLGYAVLLALRVFYAFTNAGFNASFSQDVVQVLAFLVSMVFIFALTLAFALMLFRGKEVELQHLVHHDPLTGLLNRRSLPSHAATEAARCERYGTPLSVVMIDIDHFKQINDRLGHAAGDEVIRQVAACIGLSIRETDSAFRLGGEEFLVLMPSTALGAATVGAERLRDALTATLTGESAVTCSFGVASLARGRETWDDVLRRADRALYMAKSSGRDRVITLSADEGSLPVDASAEAGVPVP